MKGQTLSVAAPPGRTLARSRLSFQPHPLVRNGNLQTLLSRVPTPEVPAVARGEQALLLDGGVDRTGYAPDRSVRLLAFYTSKLVRGPRRGLVMLLHGWEGCSHSTYNLLVGSALVRAGYDVVRLNLRDHGPTHHLNRGFFYASLIDEVVAATRQVAVWAHDDPFFIIGASMGGNFALRLALRHGDTPIHNLGRVIAVNPVLNPGRTCDRLDERPLYRTYFRRRWLRSLRRKQALFPETFDFRGIERLSTIRAMSDWLVKKYGPFADVDEYLASYAVPGDALRSLNAPVTILTAANDPIIHPQEFYELPSHPFLDVHVLASGGHVGYTDIFPVRHRLPDMVLGLLEEEDGSICR